jgi:hypothetical protein
MQDTPNNIIPMTAEAFNAPQVGKVEVLPPTADELRSALVAQFEKFKPSLEQYHEYAQRCMALAQEYHAVRLEDAFPEAKIEELTLVATLDARETPKSLDTKLAQFASENITVRRMIFDRVKSAYLLFV